METLILKEGKLSSEQVTKIQEELHQSYLTMAEQMTLLKTQEELLEASAVALEALQKANRFCNETVKNIFTILGSRKDKFKGDAEMDVLMTALAEFVINTAEEKLK
jgi:hypothetical protein